MSKEIIEIRNNYVHEERYTDEQLQRLEMLESLPSKTNQETSWYPMLIKAR